MALLAWWAFGNAKNSRAHPAQTWLLVAIVYTAAMMFHPFTSSTLAGIAQLVLYVSVMAPVFWAPAVVRGPDHLSRLMTLLLVCNGINAFVGVMQVYDPGRWMPQEMSRLVTESEFGLGAVTYQGPNGLIVRPPGLFDNPGAVAGPGMYAALLGLVFVTSASALWKRGVALVASFAGVAAIYLSQVRVSLVVLALMLATYVGLLLFQQRKQRAIVFGGMAGGIVVATFTFAISLGGESIAERTLTLFAQDPDQLVHGLARRSARLHVRRSVEHLSARRGSRPLGHDQRLLRQRLAAAAVGRDSGGGVGDRRRHSARPRQRRGARRDAVGRAAARHLGSGRRTCARAPRSSWRRTSGRRRSSSASRRS